MSEKAESSEEVKPVIATDLELAVYWSNEIENPCGVGPEQKEETRERYIREGKRALKSITNEATRVLLEERIKQYEKK